MYLVYPALLGNQVAYEQSLFLQKAKQLGADLARRFYMPCPEVEWKKDVQAFLGRPTCTSAVMKWGQIDLATNWIYLFPRAADELDPAGLEYFMGHLLLHRLISGPEWLVDLYVCEALDITDIPIVRSTAQVIAGNTTMRQMALYFKIGPRVIEIGDRLNAGTWADGSLELPYQVISTPGEGRFA